MALTLLKQHWRMIGSGAEREAEEEKKKEKKRRQPRQVREAQDMQQSESAHFAGAVRRKERSKGERGGKDWSTPKLQPQRCTERASALLELENLERCKLPIWKETEEKVEEKRKEEKKRKRKGAESLLSCGCLGRERTDATNAARAGQLRCTKTTLTPPSLSSPKGTGGSSCCRRSTRAYRSRRHGSSTCSTG